MGEREGSYRRRLVGQRRDKRTVIKHTDEEWARVAAMAAVQGISVARLYERALWAGDAVAAAKMAQVYSELVMTQRLLIGVATNVNQMAAVANSTGELPAAAQLEAALTLAQRQVDRIVEVLQTLPGGDVFRSVKRDR